MDVQLTWILIGIGVMLIMLGVLIYFALDHRQALREIAEIKAAPLSDAAKDQILAAIKAREGHWLTFTEMADGRLRNMNTLIDRLVKKLNQIFYPSSPDSPPVSKRPDSPDTKG